MQVDLDRAREAGMVDYLFKPLRIHEVERVIREHCPKLLAPKPAEADGPV
jgi:DNA-binding response OmpR family regulator